MSDHAIRAMLGFSEEPVVLQPEAPKPRLDLSRCRTYAVQQAQEAIGMYRAEYHIEPDFCIAAPIGGRTKVTGWTIGLCPITDNVIVPAAGSEKVDETLGSHYNEGDECAS